MATDLPNIEYLKERAKAGPETTENWGQFVGKVWEYLSGEMEGTVPGETRRTLEGLKGLMYSPGVEQKPLEMMELAAMGMGVGTRAGVSGLGGGPMLPKGFKSTLWEALRTGKAGKFELGKEPKAAGLLSALRKGGVTEDELMLSGVGKKLASMGQEKMAREDLMELVEANYPKFEIEAKSARGQHERDALQTAIQGQETVLFRLPDLSDKIEVTQKKLQKLESKQYKIGSPEYAKWSTEQGARIDLATGKPKAAYEERLLRIEEDLETYRSPHWGGKSSTGLVGHSRIDEARLGFDGDKVTHIDEIQSDWNIAASKEPEKFFKPGERKRYEDIGKLPGPPLRTGNVERTLVRDVVRRAWEKGSKGVTWTPAEVQAERYGKLIDRVVWQSDTVLSKPGSPFIQVTAFDPAGKRIEIGSFSLRHEGELEIAEGIIGHQAVEGIRKNPSGGEVTGRQMFKGENYEKTYNKLLPRIFKEEYGVTPEKRKIYSEELKRDIDVWYVPLTEEMKKKAFEGQKFAFLRETMGA